MKLQSMGVPSQQLFATNNCHNNVTGSEKTAIAIVYRCEDSLGNKDHTVYGFT